MRKLLITHARRILCLGALAAWSRPAHSQTEQQIADSVVLGLRRHQEVSVRLLDGTRHRARVASIDSTPARIHLRSKHDIIDARNIDSLKTNVGG